MHRMTERMDRTEPADGPDKRADGKGKRTVDCLEERIDREEVWKKEHPGN